MQELGAQSLSANQLTGVSGEQIVDQYLIPGDAHLSSGWNEKLAKALVNDLEARP